MRIAVLHDLPSGGAKRMLREQVERLGARGHDVLAFLPSTADEAFLPLAETDAEVRTVDLPAPPDRERALRALPGPRTAWAWLRFLRAQAATQRSLAGMADAAGCGAVLVFPSQFTQAPAALRHIRTPSLYFCMEPLRAAYEPGIAAPAVRLLLRATIGIEDRRNLHAATAVATHSEYTASRIDEIYGRPAYVVRPGIDFERFSPGAASSRDHLLTVGALHPLKGQDLLVEAVGRLPEALRLPLVAVADRERSAFRTRLEETAAAAGVELRVLTRVTEDELVDLYRGARVVLFAAYREPLGLVPLEAMACGRPVLAVPEGGVRETVSDGVTGFTAPRDAEAFARRLTRVLEDPEGAEEVGRTAARRVRETWTWDASVDHLEALLERVAEEAR